MIVPVRLQRSRCRGAHLAAASRAVNGLPVVIVSRPCKWGNPATIAEMRRVGYQGDDANAIAVRAFHNGLYPPSSARNRPAWARRILDDIGELTGKNLACWCRLCPAHRTGKPFGVSCAACAPCHADILGALANGFTCEAV